MAEHGLKPEEYERILQLIGREPTLTELGIFSAMWNEHCSYKSSKIHLRTLPTTGLHVIQGPGENAGVIAIGDGLAVVFKMESHNHPSYIEPYQGAATGVGGILRDVFTMGARPIACLNALSFGDPKHPKTRHLVSGVVAGVGGYGNSFGVPTVGGSVRFHSRYDGNNLVNAMAVGLAEQDKIFYAAASGVGMPIVYLGSKTGRDGIHGASMASAEFGEDSESKRPTVQVGDPFSEKLLLEACLEIMAKDCVIAIQDMGAAGLTCSAVEMGAKGDLGVRLDLEKVPTRETGMTAYEMMLSESQERMLMVLKPEKEKEAEDIFRKWGLDFAIVGETTPDKRFVVRHNGDEMANLPIKELGDEAPVYDRPHTASPRLPVIDPMSIEAPMAHAEALGKLLASPDLASKRWVWEQYDHIILGNTVQRPGGDAAVIRVKEGPKGLALTTDVTPRYCEADPVRGRQAGGRRDLAQSLSRRCQAHGADRQSQLRQSGAARDHGPARRLHPGHRHGLQGARIPGRVGQRLALQRDEWPRDPADADHRRRRTARRLHEIRQHRLQGRRRVDRAARRDQGLDRPVALPARDLRARGGGAAAGRPDARSAAAAISCAALIDEKFVTAVHDISDGGLLVAVAEMALASGIGAKLYGPPAFLTEHGFWFGEDQARYVVTIKADQFDDLAARAKTAGVPIRRIGMTHGNALTLPGEKPLLLDALRERHEGWLPAYMAGGAN